MPIELSKDRKELIRKIAADGLRILTLEAKLKRLPEGSGRDAVLQQLRPLKQTHEHRLMRIQGVKTNGG